MSAKKDGYAKEWLTKEEWRLLKSQPMERDFHRREDYLRQRDSILLRIMYKGGLRISEVLELQYPYNFRTTEGRGELVLKGSKTREDTEVEVQPVGQELVREISNFMSYYGEEKETNYIFDITRQRAYDLMNEYGDSAGIDKKLGTHTLRRSRAKHLLEAGWELQDVSAFLRHDSLSSTMEYLRIAKKRLHEKMDATDKEENL